MPEEEWRVAVVAVVAVVAMVAMDRMPKSPPPGRYHFDFARRLVTFGVGGEGL